ncbi:MAG: MGMT family protein [Deltaproteobacteria bacterium]|nr:MGMT family protein [Deltaproteobacteria bacterium]
MEIFHYKTPFNRWLTVRIENGIFSLDFLNNKQGKEVEGEIKDLLVSFFSSYGKFLPPWEILNTEAYSPSQIKLYKEVRKIKAGETSSYKELAEKLCCHPRIIGKMLSLNRHALFIPCHRIIRKNGFLGGYRWSRKLKEEIITWETSY